MDNHYLAEIDAQRRAESAIDAIKIESQRWRKTNRRPPALTAREGLVAIEFEALFVWTVAHCLANGLPPSALDLDRLTLACRRIDAICGEVVR